VLAWNIAVIGLPGKITVELGAGKAIFAPEAFYHLTWDE
jgi:hypothetical protein